MRAANDAQDWLGLTTGLGILSFGRPALRLKAQIELYDERYAHLLPLRRVRAWTDEVLLDAFESSDAWADVFSKLGVSDSGSSKRKVRLRAAELGCDIDKFPKFALRQSPDRFGACARCGNQMTKRGKFCNSICRWAEVEIERAAYIERWLLGEETGTTAGGMMKAVVKQHVLRLANFSCMKCDWDELHPYDGLPLVQVDHINGNAYDNRFTNLRVLCPNHHSMTPNYGFRNAGKGRSILAKKLAFRPR